MDGRRSFLHVGHQLTLGRFLLDGYLGGTWTSEDDMGIYYEDLPLFPQASGLRVSGGLRLGIRAWRPRRPAMKPVVQAA